MASVTGFTAERMQEIEDSAIVDGNIVAGHLILVRNDGVEIDAGDVTGPQGPVGPAGAVSIAVVTSATRPGAGARFEGLYIYETDTDRVFSWDGAAWIYRGGKVFCTAATRPAAPFAGLEIYETDTKRNYQYDGAAWRYLTNSGGTNPTAARGFAGAATASIVGWKKIALNSETYDYGNNFAAGTYVVPESRMYECKGRASVSTVFDTDRFILAIYVNGVERSRGSDVTSAADNTTIGGEVSDRLALVAGDTVELWMYCSAAGRNTDVGTAMTYLNVQGVL